MRTVLKFIQRASLVLASALHRGEERRVAEHVERRRRDLLRRTAGRIGSY
jgi:hypothetical protein